MAQATSSRPRNWRYALEYLALVALGRVVAKGADVALGKVWPPGGKWQPSIDLYEQKDAFLLRAEVPDVRAEDIDLSIRGNTVTIRGERKPPEDLPKKDARFCETCRGSFSRSVVLPREVKADDIDAVLDNGILEVRLAKLSPEEPSVKVDVKPVP